MKKSEFIKKLDEKLKLYAPPEDDIEALNLLVYIIEELGMLPPLRSGNAKTKILNRCKWEPEDG